MGQLLGLNEIFKPTVVASLLVKFPVAPPDDTALSPKDVCAQPNVISPKLAVYLAPIPQVSLPFVGESKLVPVDELPASVVYEKLPLNFSLNFLPTPILYVSQSEKVLICVPASFT